MSIVDIEDIDVLIATLQRVDPLSSSHPTERFTEKSCSCKKCAAACLRHPGFFDPEGFMLWVMSECDGEIDEGIIRETLKRLHPLTTKDYYIEDQSVGTKFMIRPAIDNEIPGKKPAFFPHGVCIMLGPTGCKLSQQHRPIECTLAYNCQTPKTHWSKKESVDSWQSPLGLLILKIYDEIGRELYYDDYTSGDMMPNTIDMMRDLKY